MLPFYKLGEHFLRIDGDEDAAAAGEDFVFVVEDFGGVDVGASLHFFFAAFYAEGFVKRNGFQVFDGHLAGEGDDVMEFVDLAHGVVEDGGDDASVAVAGRSGVAFAEAEMADESWRSSSRMNLRRMPSGYPCRRRSSGFSGASCSGFRGLGACRAWRDSIARLSVRVTLQRPASRTSLFDLRLRGGARDLSTTVVLRIREAQPPLKMTLNRDRASISERNHVYISFWKTLDWSPS